MGWKNIYSNRGVSFNAEPKWRFWRVIWPIVPMCLPRLIYSDWNFFWSSFFFRGDWVVLFSILYREQPIRAKKNAERGNVQNRSIKALPIALSTSRWRRRLVGKQAWIFIAVLCIHFQHSLDRSFPRSLPQTIDVLRCLSSWRGFSPLSGNWFCGGHWASICSFFSMSFLLFIYLFS